MPCRSCRAPVLDDVACRSRRLAAWPCADSGAAEYAALISQIAISRPRHGGRWLVGLLLVGMDTSSEPGRLAILLDAELAALYGVTTKPFDEQVRRNLDRFPPDFMFRLTTAELVALRSQIATLKGGGCEIEVAICDLKSAHRPRRPQLFPSCRPRARCHPGRQRLEKSPRRQTRLR